MKHHEQVHAAVTNKSRMLGMLRSAWNPFTSTDIDCFECVQRKATRLVRNARGLDYPSRCSLLGLEPLSKRRERGDLIQMFKIINGLDIVSWHYPPLWRAPRGGHRARLVREIVHCCEPRHHFFYNRIANAWNALPDAVVSASSVNSFKAKLDAFRSII